MSAARAAPTRPSLRTSDAPARPERAAEGRSPASKRVSFAAESTPPEPAPAPARGLLRLPFVRRARADNAPAAPRDVSWWPRARSEAAAAPSHPTLAAPADAPRRTRARPLSALFSGAAPSAAPSVPSALPSVPPSATSSQEAPRNTAAPPAGAARAPAADSAAPARAPQLSPLRLPASPLLEIPATPKPKTRRARPQSLVIAPNRLTGPEEKSLVSPIKDVAPSKPPRGDDKEPDLYEALSQHMSTHQQQQGFAPTREAAVPAPGAPGASGVRRTPSAALVRPARPPGPRDAAALERPPARWGTLFRTQRAPLPHATLPGAEEHDVLTTAASSAARAATEDGAPLRALHLPASLVPAFLACARANTLADRETCALLLGREVGGALYVTDLVVPPQSGTSDSCTATSEEATAALQVAEGLLTLGWIHTHPSQSCFLSSLDLHTQAGYQALLPEAVAVVCAPRHRPSLGVFRLTDPWGLRYLLQCRNPAPFHAHVVPGEQGALPLYTDATHGHVRLDDARGARVRVRDLR